ncbi:DUF4238 domain-containing protein [Streptomyces flaveolus]|uniref:DUF4238 domain-containing protein n=1 Tax=Streptomyces flaveolus TaxID=67297 RepID=UPI003430FBD9
MGTSARLTRHRRDHGLPGSSTAHPSQTAPLTAETTGGFGARPGDTQRSSSGTESHCQGARSRCRKPTADLTHETHRILETDGYRAQLAVFAGGRVLLRSRQGTDMTASFPEIQGAALAHLPADTGLDGELVVWERGRLAFERLQQAPCTTEVIVGAVTGSVAAPRTVLLGRYDAAGRLQYVGRNTALSRAAGRALADQLAPPSGPHPWEGWTFSPGWGTRRTLDVHLVHPDVVVEVAVDVARDSAGRWRHPEQLRLEALRETGLYLSGPDALGAFAKRLIEWSSVMRDRESGKLFRTSIEDTFHEMRDLASTRRLEVLTPETGQFLIGDNPALTLSVKESRTIHGMAFSDAQTLILPISPRHLLSLGTEDVMLTVPQSFVDRLNAVQVHAAHRYVYMHPDSGLEPFVERAARRRPAGDRTT